MKNIFVPSTKKNSGDSVPQEDVEFVYWKNPKTGDEFKLLNLENEDLAPREGIIELKPIKTTRRHENSVGFRLLNDKSRDCYIGIPVQFDHKDGRPIWQKINLTNFDTFDLSIPAQRREWICIKNCPYYSDMVGGVEQNVNFDAGVKNVYKAIDKEREADQFARNRKIKRKAEDIAEALLDDKDQLTEIALMCGFDPKVMSKQRLWAEVVKFAESKPEDFMKIYNSDLRSETAIFKNALLTGVLHDSLNEGFNFNGLTIGHNEQEAINYLKEHAATAASINALSKKKDKGSDEVAAKSKPVTESNAKELLLQKQIDELTAQLSKVTDVKIDELSTSILTTEDPEFLDLRAQAKQLDCKGYAKVKDKDKLRSMIAEKQKLKQN
jgi:hypothetical protein